MGKYDPELIPKLSLIPEYNFNDINLMRETSARLYAAASMKDLPQDVTIHEELISDKEYTKKIPIRIYRGSKHAKKPSPALIYLHGGGFATAPPDALLDKLCSEICSRLTITVIAIKYSLAPENPFPAALLDCYSTLEWISDDKTLNIDDMRLATYGSSAGATLAAGLSLLTRDRNGPQIHFQLLETPALDNQLRTDSAKKITTAPMLSTEALRQMWGMYLSAQVHIDGRDGLQYAAPLHATNLRSLPPTCIMVCEIDPLRDEAILFANRLMQEDVPTELHTYSGTFHGSMVFSDVKITKRMLHDRDDALQRALTQG